MGIDASPEPSQTPMTDGGKAEAFTPLVPFIWPEARFIDGSQDYTQTPPFRSLFINSDWISGLMVGAGDGVIMWLEELLAKDNPLRIRLVLILYPACPTREQHLRALHELQARYSESGKTLQIRLHLMSSAVGNGGKRLAIPPTVLQGFNSQSRTGIMAIGSVGDFGTETAALGSVNFVFQPDDVYRHAWRVWFRELFGRSVDLSEETIHIPHLIPATGDPKAVKYWHDYEDACKKPQPLQSPGNGVGVGKVEPQPAQKPKEVDIWDEGQIAPDPLALRLQQVYASGWLVTVDEATRIKPLTIPVKPKLLGLRAESTVGALTQRQSFELEILEADLDKSIEQCRSITDLLEVLTHPLSPGIRWLPGTARAVLERELDLRNEEGHRLLNEALGGDVDQFIAKKTDAILRDVNDMYRRLGQNMVVPEDKSKVILMEVTDRLRQAFTGRITPSIICNRIAATELTSPALDHNWNQPLSLLVHSARVLREVLIHPGRFARFAFTEPDFPGCLDVFGDIILQRKRDAKLAKYELTQIDMICISPKPAKEKCREVWSLITGKPVPLSDAAPSQSLKSP